MKYGKKYFTSGNYASYLHREEKHNRTVEDVDSILQSFLPSQVDMNILDYGCALGWLSGGLLKRGYKKVIGYDISSWALQQASEKGIPVTPTLPKGVGVLIALDVFEHIDDEGILKDITHTSPAYILARIPCALPGEKDYALEVSRRDVTHINCKDKEGWKHFFRNIGYEMTAITTATIYDSEGVLCGVFTK